MSAKEKKTEKPPRERPKSVTACILAREKSLYIGIAVEIPAEMLASLPMKKLGDRDILENVERKIQFALRQTTVVQK